MGNLDQFLMSSVYNIFAIILAFLFYMCINHYLPKVWGSHFIVVLCTSNIEILF